MERDVQDATERVGQFEVRIEVAEPAPEAKQCWSQRADALLAWLLCEWDRQQQKEAA
jgi:hypothetical protein